MQGSVVVAHMKRILRERTRRHQPQNFQSFPSLPSIDEMTPEQQERTRDLQDQAKLSRAIAQSVVTALPSRQQS